MKYLNKDLYIKTFEEYIKDSFENWETDIIFLLKDIKENFPNTAKALNCIYPNLNCGSSYLYHSLKFAHTPYVFEAISSFIPKKKKLRFNIATRPISDEYKYLNISTWKHFINIKRTDLLISIFLFLEEIIMKPVPKKYLTDNGLFFETTFTTLKITKKGNKTAFSVKIKDVITIHYIIINS